MPENINPLVLSGLRVRYVSVRKENREIDRDGDFVDVMLSKNRGTKTAVQIIPTIQHNQKLTEDE